MLIIGNLLEIQQNISTLHCRKVEVFVSQEVVRRRGEVRNAQYSDSIAPSPFKARPTTMDPRLLQCYMRWRGGRRYQVLECTTVMTMRSSHVVAYYKSRKSLNPVSHRYAALRVSHKSILLPPRNSPVLLPRRWPILTGLQCSCNRRHRQCCVLRRHREISFRASYAEPGRPFTSLERIVRDLFRLPPSLNIIGKPLKTVIGQCNDYYVV